MRSVFALLFGQNPSGDDVRLQTDANNYLYVAVGSAAVAGDVAHDAADSGNPVKVGVKAATTMPTPVADGDRADMMGDDLGRPVMTLHQVRDLRKTAYATLSSNAETTLLAAAAGYFHDCHMVTGANTSDQSVTVDIRAVTGGNIVNTIELPAEGTAGWCPTIPWPQDETGNDWTVDFKDADISNTTVYLSGLFTQEV